MKPLTLSLAAFYLKQARLAEGGQVDARSSLLDGVAVHADRDCTSLTTE